MSVKNIKKEVVAAVGGPGRKGYEITIYYRVREGDKSRIVSETITEPYEEPLEKAPPGKIREIVRKAKERLMRHDALRHRRNSSS